MKFFRSPLEFIEDLRAEGCVGSILLSINKLEDGGRIAVPTGMEEILPTGLVLKSVGYSSSCPDDAIPFDGRKGIIANEAGRVTGLPGASIGVYHKLTFTESDMYLENNNLLYSYSLCRVSRWCRLLRPEVFHSNWTLFHRIMRVCITIFNCTFLGVYCSGWVKTGPIGVIVSTMNSSFETGSNLLSDINKGAIDGTVSKPGRNFIVNDILKKKGVYGRCVCGISC